MTGPSLGALPATPWASGVEACRRVAERLGLDVVGVAVNGAARRTTWWTAPDARPLPARIDEVLEGRVADFIVCPLAEGTAFARPREGAGPGAAGGFRSAAPSLVRAVLRGEPLPVESTAEERPAEARDPLGAVAAAVRRHVASAEGVPALLDAVRGALGAEHVFHLRERGPDLEVASVPLRGWPRAVPEGIRNGLARLGRGPAALDQAQARQLAVVLGAGGAAARAASCAGADGLEILLATWERDPGLEPGTVEAVAALVGVGRAAVEAHVRAAEARLHRERTRWAFEVHDGIIQAATGALLELRALRERIATDPGVAIERLREVEMEIRRALGELRSILFDLSGDRGPGPDASLEATVRELAGRWRLSPKVTVRGDLGSVPRRVLDAAFVVLREAIANAAKHAGAREVEIVVAVEGDELVVEVRDRGRGFAPDATLDGPHFGLDLMHRTVEEVGGRLEVGSSPGSGTRVAARLPVRERGVEP
jgi:signal transduction histidine kinase